MIQKLSFCLGEVHGNILKRYWHLKQAIAVVSGEFTPMGPRMSWQQQKTWIVVGPRELSKSCDSGTGKCNRWRLMRGGWWCQAKVLEPHSPWVWLSGWLPSWGHMDAKGVERD